MPRLQIMDTTIRDGQQSLWATRMQIGDMLPILPKMDRVGYWVCAFWTRILGSACAPSRTRRPTPPSLCCRAARIWWATSITRARS